MYVFIILFIYYLMYGKEGITLRKMFHYRILIFNGYFSVNSHFYFFENGIWKAMVISKSGFWRTIKNAGAIKIPNRYPKLSTECVMHM